MVSSLLVQKKISSTQKGEKYNNPEYETHKINSIFVSCRNVKGPQTPYAALTARGTSEQVGAWWGGSVSYVNGPADPGLHNPMSFLLSFGSF